MALFAYDNDFDIEAFSGEDGAFHTWAGAVIATHCIKNNSHERWKPQKALNRREPERVPCGECQDKQDPTVLGFCDDRCLLIRAA